ncbi:MAG: hypothetical protein ACK4RF_03600 [Cyclobacteriaceae bacterium]
MKFIVQMVVIAVLGWLLTLFLPWWSVAVAGFAGGYAAKSKANFTAGFFAIAILWLLHALLIEMNASAPLTEKVAALLMVKSKTLLFAVTSVIGGLVGGFSTLTGSLLRPGKRREY